MKILNASDAKREFGEVLINAQHGPEYWQASDWGQASDNP